MKLNEKNGYCEEEFVKELKQNIQFFEFSLPIFSNLTIKNISPKVNFKLYLIQNGTYTTNRC